MYSGAGHAHFSPGVMAIIKKYEIIMIMLKYNGNACRLYLLCFGAPDDIIL